MSGGGAPWLPDGGEGWSSSPPRPPRCTVCPGNLIETSFTRILWRAWCDTCGRCSHLNNELEWEAGGSWAPYAILILWFGFIWFISFLAEGGWA